MAQQLISIACEGPHDVAFLNRLLKAQGFRTHERTKIGDYPPPIGSFFENSVRRTDFQQLNFAEARHVPLPSHALIRDSTFVFLHSLGGDSKKDDRISLLSELGTFVQADENEIPVCPTDTSLSVIFLFDADEVGVSARVKQVKNEVAEAFGVDAGQVDLSENGAFCEVNRLRVGCFILADEEEENGKLEHLLVPLMREKNEAIFEAAERFLDDFFEQERTKFLRIREEDGTLVEKRGSSRDFDRMKSIIGIVAQLQISGKPNAACINRTDYTSRH